MYMWHCRPLLTAALVLHSSFLCASSICRVNFVTELPYANKTLNINHLQCWPLLKPLSMHRYDEWQPGIQRYTQRHVVLMHKALA